jgi:hypothetical protein
MVARDIRVRVHIRNQIAMKRSTPIKTRSVTAKQQSFRYYLPREIWLAILNYLGRVENLPTLWRLQLVSTEWLAMVYESVTQLGGYLSHFDDDSLGKLTSLRRITVFNNPTISDAGISKLVNLEGLTLLFLDWNTSRGQVKQKITSACFAALTNLTSLTLSFDSAIGGAISTLVKLTKLCVHFDRNPIVSIADHHLSPLTNLTVLELNRNQSITSSGLARLTNLISLKLLNEVSIGNEGIQGLTMLTSLVLNCYLSLERAARITDDGVTGLTNLTILDLNYQPSITDRALWNLLNLAKLYLNGVTTVTDHGITRLSNLTVLSLDSNDRITDAGLAGLTKLMDLSLADNDSITDDALSRLTNLTNLNLNGNEVITDSSVSCLTNLLSLSQMPTKLTDRGFSTLTRLTSLFITFALDHCKTISDVSFRGLTNLKTLGFSHYKDSALTVNGLSKMKNLQMSYVYTDERLVPHGLSTLRDLIQFIAKCSK